MTRIRHSHPLDISRRQWLTRSSLALGALALSPGLTNAQTTTAKAAPAASTVGTPIRLSFNENPWGPSPHALQAIRESSAQAARYADASTAQALAEQIAAHEGVAVEQVVLGEILEPLGAHLAAQGGPGGEFIHTTPGYLALLDAAGHAGGVAIEVPLDAQLRNDLPALKAKVNAKTRAVFLVNPHNPSGTTSDPAAFQNFLREVSQRTLVIVDEAYLEYSDDFSQRSAVALVRQGANVIVFRTFAKIHGLAGLPIGYGLLPKPLAAQLRKQGVGNAHNLGRLNLAAASAALSDTGFVTQTRDAVARERHLWHQQLQALGVTHSDSTGNFVFFRTCIAHSRFAATLRDAGIEIGRGFPGFDDWARISIGLPAENAQARAAVAELLGNRRVT